MSVLIGLKRSPLLTIFLMGYSSSTLPEELESRLYPLIQFSLKSKGLHVVTVAYSAAAAQLLDDGRTAHSAFKISIPLD